MSFVVMSDTHIIESSEQNKEHFINALEDIRDNMESVATIVIVGDITDRGRSEDYDLVRLLCEEAGYDYDADITKVMGNHDQYSEEFDPSKAGHDEQYLRFMQQVGIDHVYYHFDLNGQHFICLGPDENKTGDWTRFNFSDEQMAWLTDLLDKDEQTGRPSYVFCHEPLPNTLKNTEDGTWAARNSIEDPDEVWAAIGNRPNVVFFTGHTHRYPDIARLDEHGPLFVNDGAAGPGRFPPGQTDHPEGATGSFGWLVSVFGDRAEFKMRDFLEHEWVNDLDYKLMFR